MHMPLDDKYKGEVNMWVIGGCSLEMALSRLGENAGNWKLKILLMQNLVGELEGNGKQSVLHIGNGELRHVKEIWELGGGIWKTMCTSRSGKILATPLLTLVSPLTKMEYARTRGLTYEQISYLWDTGARERCPAPCLWVFEVWRLLPEKRELSITPVATEDFGFLRIHVSGT